MDRIGNGVVNASPEECITVGTGGRPALLGVDIEAPSPSTSLRLDNSELGLFCRPLNEMRPRIRRATFGSLELEVSMTAAGVTGSCMPKVRTGPEGCRVPGLAIN